MSKKKDNQPENKETQRLNPDEPLKDQSEIKPEVNWEDVAKRALADLDNYKKQQEKLRGELTQFMNMALLTRFLDINDDLSRVLHTVQNKKLDPSTIPPDVLQCQMGVMEGITNILKKFDEVFKAEGLDKIEVKPGDKFDPSIMEAVSHEDHTEHKDDTVIEQLQAGLKYKDQIIKPAKVRVGK
ncbi:MAG: nucleotide exchange factor GrpE [Patescibacteria group bacterium]|jgi:molecular chaperone GrpE